jgi:collagen type I/II/III/V/XI/XXIV/XXVII alpha
MATLILVDPNTPSTFSPTQTNPAFQTTSGDDVIESLQPGDLASNITIDGGGGTNELVGAVGGGTINPSLANVQVVALDPYATGAFDAAGDTGLQTVSEFGGSFGGPGGVTYQVLNLTQSVASEMENQTGFVDNLTVSFTGLAASGNSETLVLFGNAGGQFDTSLSSGDGINTYNIQSTGKANTVSIGAVDTQLTTINVSGGSVLSLTNTNSGVTTINGSAATGSLDISTGAVTGQLSLTGGSGNDTLNASAATKKTALVDGNGADTLIFNGAVAANSQTVGTGADVVATQGSGGGMTFIAAADTTSNATLVGDVDVVNGYTHGSTEIVLQGLSGAGYTVATLTGTQLASAEAASNLLNATKTVAALMSGKQVAAFEFGADEYIYQQNSFSGTFSAGDGLMKLTSAASVFGNSDLSLTGSVSCFAAGTSIATGRGDLEVETLRAGDRVLLHDGRTTPIVWLGQRFVACARHTNPEQVWPVRVSKDAFGPGLPRRDLFLSPDHAVFVDGVLIPVKYLIDGVSIAQIQCENVTYYHISLAEHDVLLAEGLPAESYLEHGDRSDFDNGGTALTLHPDFCSRAWEAFGCAPLIVTGRTLETVRNRLSERAALPPARSLAGIRI